LIVEQEKTVGESPLSIGRLRQLSGGERIFVVSGLNVEVKLFGIYDERSSESYRNE
jgi:hypothetical protein